MKSTVRCACRSKHKIRIPKINARRKSKAEEILVKTLFFTPSGASANGLFMCDTLKSLKDARNLFSLSVFLFRNDAPVLLSSSV